MEKEWKEMPQIFHRNCDGWVIGLEEVFIFFYLISGARPRPWGVPGGLMFGNASHWCSFNFCSAFIEWPGRNW